MAEDKTTTDLAGRLEALNEQVKDTFFVYDNRKPVWGHAFNFSDQTYEEGIPVSHFSGFRDGRRPHEGDRMVTQTNKGKLGLFLLFNTKASENVNDLFYADGVCIDGDYQGKFGLKGEEETETRYDAYSILIRGLEAAHKKDGPG